MGNFLSVYRLMVINNKPQAVANHLLFPGGIGFTNAYLGGRIKLRDYIEERILETAWYIVEHGATVRDAANVFSISKSTVHKDMAERLRSINPTLAADVRKVLDFNKAERHIRGGRATHRKYKGEDEQTAGV